MTALETALFSILSGIIVGLVVKFSIGTGKVSCQDCDKRHAALDEELAAVAQKDKYDHAMILRMLRSIGVHLDIAPEKKVATLTATGAVK